jgi:hypothetical protein
MRTRDVLTRWGVLATALLVVGSACELGVTNPNVIEAGDLDPEADAAILAKSSMQDFTEAYQWLVLYPGWFTGELRSAHIQEFANDANRREIDTDSGNLDQEAWGPIVTARKSAAEVLGILEDASGPEVEMNRLRASYVAGYSFLSMAIVFCQGTVDAGPALQTSAMLDSAVTHFTRALQTGQGLSGAEAESLTEASRLGRARAHLQAGSTSEALSDAQAIPEDFSYALNYVSDPEDRRVENPRLGNVLFRKTYFGDKVMSVAPAFRELDDPRVGALPPSEHDIQPRDGVTEYWAQTKYTGFESDILLASRLEADYLVAEIEGTDAMLDMIQDRRAANDQPAYDGPVDDGSVLEEFLWQKTLDFYLEGKRMGDFQRHPDAIRAMPEPGAAFHKPAAGPIGDQTCFPLPDTETDNNPNF